VNPGSERSEDQGRTFPTSIEASVPSTFSGSFPSGSGGGYSGFDLWLHRLTVLLFVFVCAVVGVLLVIVPWRPEWTDNRLLFTYPGLRSLIGSGFVRGLTSGLGLLNIWIGFWEAIHYQEGKSPSRTP
jgi:hypothetical protein